MLKTSMKTTRFFTVLCFVFFLISTVFAQQQGLGIVFNEKPLLNPEKQSFSGQPLVKIPPVCGKKRRNMGLNLPFPFGAGAYGLWYEQDFIARKLLITDSTGRVTVTPDTMIQNTTASEMKLQFRPDVWLLPFLNVYGIIGYTEGKVNPDLIIPSFTMHIEGLPEIPIDTSFELKDQLTYHGPTYGFGLTFAMGFNAFFVLVDYNYTETYPTDQEGKLVNHAFSTRLGVQLAAKKGEGRGAVWLGGMLLTNNQTFSGVINVEEISPTLALILGKEADYTGNIVSKQQWNMLIGGSYYINKHHSLVIEAGFIGRKQISLVYAFRF